MCPRESLGLPKTRSSLLQTMALHQAGATPGSRPMLSYDQRGNIILLGKLSISIQRSHDTKILPNFRLQNRRLCLWGQKSGRHTFNISRTLVGNKRIGHSDVVEAAPLHSRPGFNRMGKGNCKMRLETFKFGDMVRLIQEIWQHIVRILEKSDHVNTAPNCVSILGLLGHQWKLLWINIYNITHLRTPDIGTAVWLLIGVIACSPEKWICPLNSLRPRQNDRNVPDDILK